MTEKRFQGIKPQFIPMRLSEFCAQVIYWGQGQVTMTYLERAARIHHQLVSIHPFENGNGRFSRLIADRYLLAYKCVHPIWPSYLGVNGEIRDRYISCLKEADHGNYLPLIQFMQEFHAEE